MVNCSVTVLATTPPAAERGPDPPAGNVTRTRVPGRNGVDGVNVSVVPAFVQVPGVAGSRTGIGEVAASGADSVTRTGLAPLVRVTAPPWVTDSTCSGGAAWAPDWWSETVVACPAEPDAPSIPMVTPATTRTPTPPEARRILVRRDLGAAASPGFPAAGLPPWPSPPRVPGRGTAALAVPVPGWPCPRRYRPWSRPTGTPWAAASTLESARSAPSCSLCPAPACGPSPHRPARCNAFRTYPVPVRRRVSRLRLSYVTARAPRNVLSG